MTRYSLIGAGGRVAREVESDETQEEMEYQYINGTSVQGVIPRDELPEGMSPIPVQQTPSGCEGYEEGFQSDRILTEEPPPELLNKERREE